MEVWLGQSKACGWREEGRPQAGADYGKPGRAPELGFILLVQGGEETGS